MQCYPYVPTLWIINTVGSRQNMITVEYLGFYCLEISLKMQKNVNLNQHKRNVRKQNTPEKMSILVHYQCYFVFTWNGYLWGGETSWPPTILSSSSGIALVALHKKKLIPLYYVHCSLQDLRKSSKKKYLLTFSIIFCQWMSLYYKEDGKVIC